MITSARRRCLALLLARSRAISNVAVNVAWSDDVSMRFRIFYYYLRSHILLLSLKRSAHIRDISSVIVRHAQRMATALAWDAYAVRWRVCREQSPISELIIRCRRAKFAGNVFPFYRLAKRNLSSKVNAFRASIPPLPYPRVVFKTSTQISFNFATLSVLLYCTGNRQMIIILMSYCRLALAF